MVTHGGNAYIAHRSLEFDERMGLVVQIRWTSLATRAEISVMADGTLVAVTSDDG
jgi:phage I-like protein